MYWLLVGLMSPLGGAHHAKSCDQSLEPACIMSGSLNIEALDLLQNMQNTYD